MRRLLSLAGVCAIAGCTRARTEIVVTVRTTLPAGAVGALRVVVRDDGPTGPLRFDQTHATGEPGWGLPLTFGLVPTDPDAARRVWIEASACPTATGCAVGAGAVSQRASLAYAPQQTLAFDLWLDAACDVGALRCEATLRCAVGRCVEASSAQAELRPYPSDGGGPPATGDATIPDVSDATTLDARDATAPDAVDAAVTGSSDATMPDARDAAVTDAGEVGADVADAVTDAEATTLTQRSCAGDAAGCGMLVVPGGTFTLGEPVSCGDAGAVDGACALNASPEVPSVTVRDFAVDRYEVSVGRFRAFWAAHARDHAATRARSVAYPNGRVIPWSGPDAREPYAEAGDAYSWSTTPVSPEREAHPINGVDWWTALEFCAWDGGRLPTEAEWEYLARGRAADGLAPGRAFAFGDETPFDCVHAAINASGCGGQDGLRTYRVDALLAYGGVYDLVGNLSEWAADDFARHGTCWSPSTPSDPLCQYTADRASDNGLRTLRGGTFASAPGPELRAASRRSLNADYQAQYSVGIRCARSLR